MTEELTVDVPLVPVGVSAAIDVAGGTLLHMTETVKVRALPDHLPQSIEYPIESLVDFDVAIYVRDLTIPGDVTLLTDLDEIVAKVQAPRVEEVIEPVVVEGEEGAEAAEGAEGVRRHRARTSRAPTRADARSVSRAARSRTRSGRGTSARPR